MTLLWTLTASFLYAEIVVCILLLLPIEAYRWRALFKSRAFSFIVSYANFYFGFFLLLLVIMLFDSIREIKRFSVPLSTDELKGNPMSENTQHMKLFRAQRNFYIAGFSVFLFLVLRRLVVMINNVAVLQADFDASKKQAVSATEAAKQFMDKKSEKSAVEVEWKKKVDSLKDENEKLTNDLKHSQLDLETLKEQAASNNKQYDNLLKEVEVLHKELAKAQKIQEVPKKDE